MSDQGNLEIVPVSDARAEAPAYMSVDGAALWNRIVNSLPADYIRPSDEPMLASYCEASIELAECTGIIRVEGTTISPLKQMVDEDEDTYAARYARLKGAIASEPHPLIATQGKLSAIIATLGGKLRINPSSRLQRGLKPQKGVAGGGGPRPWRDNAL